MIDYNELAKQAGAIKSTSPVGNTINYDQLAQQAGAIQPTPTVTPPPTKMATSGIGAESATPIDWTKSNLPGAKIGQSLGTLGGYGIAALSDFINHIRGEKTTLAKNYDLSSPSPEQVTGDVVRSAGIIGGLAAAPATIPGAIGAGALSGALQAGGESAVNKANATDIAKNAGIGGLAGGATAGVVSSVGSLLSHLPNRLVQGALPKLESKNISKVLSDTKVGTIASLLKESETKASTLGNKIESILTNPTYSGHVGEGSRALEDAAKAFPRSEYNTNDVVDAVRSVVPQYGKTITALQDGTATLAQKNELRSAIDIATKKIFTDSPQVSSTKQLAASLASALRGEVQAQAPETAPLFADYSRELNLKNALSVASKKLDKSSPINLYSVLSFLSGGLPAAIGEEFARNPATALVTAKVINKGVPAIKGTAPRAGALVGGAVGKYGASANNESQ